MPVQLKSHLGEQLLEGNLLAFEEPQHPLLCHQKVYQICLDALRVVHIVDILVPGAGVADEMVEVAVVRWWSDVRSTVVRSGRTSGASWVAGRPVSCGRPVGRGQREIDRISWILDGFRGGDGGGRLDLLATQQIHGSKPTKHYQNSQNTKKIGAIFVGIFGLGQKTTKSS